MFKPKFTNSSTSFNAKFSGTNPNFDLEYNDLQVIKGEDGFSPIVTTEKTEAGHKITIIDKENTEVIDILNGLNPYIKDGFWYVGDVNTNVKANIDLKAGIGIDIDITNGVQTVSLNQEEEILIDCGNASEYY